jgi:hypothetical protein
MVPFAGKGWEFESRGTTYGAPQGVPTSGLVCATVQIDLGGAIKVVSRFYRDAQMARREVQFCKVER